MSPQRQGRGVFPLLPSAGAAVRMGLEHGPKGSCAVCPAPTWRSRGAGPWKRQVQGHRNQDTMSREPGSFRERVVVRRGSPGPGVSASCLATWPPPSDLFLHPIRPQPRGSLPGLHRWDPQVLAQPTRAPLPNKVSGLGCFCYSNTKATATDRCVLPCRWVGQNAHLWPRQLWPAGASLCQDSRAD